MTMNEETVFAIDDDAGVRDSLRFLFEAAGFSARTYASAEEFLSAVDSSASGCVVVDVRMPGMSGLDLQKELSRRDSALPVIIITGHGDIAMAVDALKAGAVDFVEKPIREDRLLGSLREALARGQVTRRTMQESGEIVAKVERLTPREREVMDLVAAGFANKEAAQQLGISARTVEIHRARVMEKMGADSLSELVRMVLRLKESGPAAG